MRQGKEVLQIRQPKAAGVREHRPGCGQASERWSQKPMGRVKSIRFLWKNHKPTSNDSLLDPRRWESCPPLARSCTTAGFCSTSCQMSSDLGLNDPQTQRPHSLLGIPIILLQAPCICEYMHCGGRWQRDVGFPIGGSGKSNRGCRPWRMPNPWDTGAGHGNTVGLRAPC